MNRLSIVAVVAILASANAAAQAPVAPSSPEPIKDNSFLIEEAYNQEGRVVQHISTFSHSLKDGTWAFSFTQEWPMGGMRNQFSVTLPLAKVGTPGNYRSGLGDVALNYRNQLVGMHGGALAIAPRLSLVLPTGNASKGLGAGAAGIQTMLPMSVEVGKQLVVHGNAGASWTGGSNTTSSVTAGGSAIWLVAQHVNLMLESIWNRVSSSDANNVRSITRSMVVSPGIRGSFDLASGMQIVPGIALPLGIGSSAGTRSLFTYFSVEHPF